LRTDALPFREGNEFGAPWLAVQITTVNPAIGMTREDFEFLQVSLVDTESVVLQDFALEHFP
jgi:hypothetical protein